MIPFYDYYELREFARTRPEFIALRNHNKTNEYIKKMNGYNRMIRKMSQQ